MGGDFKIQGQGGQVVADQVVQFPCDAHTLGDTGVVRQQGLGGTQLRIYLAQFIPGFVLPQRHHAAHKCKQGNREEQPAGQRRVAQGIVADVVQNGAAAVREG